MLIDLNRFIREERPYWEELDDNVVALGETHTFTDEDVPDGARWVLYRVRIPYPAGGISSLEHDGKLAESAPVLGASQFPR